MTKRETSTFTLHHDRCDPSKWTVTEWKLLADFCRTGELSYAASLSRLGLQLVLSDKHEATGGAVEPCGYLSDGEVVESLHDLDLDHSEVAEVVPIYRGHTRYAVPYGVGDDHDWWTEIDTFDTAAEAEKFAAALKPEAA